MTDIVDLLGVGALGPGCNSAICKLARDEIKRLRAEREQDAEPVAWIDAFGEPFRHRNEIDADKAAFPAYTSPPKRKPLTDGQINSGMDLSMLSEDQRCAFGAGVRFAERAHEISDE